MGVDMDALKAGKEQIAQETTKEGDSPTTPGFTGFGIRNKLAGAIGSLFGAANTPDAKNNRP